jgi:hypothetical protein
MNSVIPIDEGTIKCVCSEVDIVVIINRYTHLYIKGPVYIGHCPLCHDKHDKFVINPERKRWRCFACAKHGDVFDFMMEKEYLTFEQAVQAVTAQLFNTISFDAIPDMDFSPETAPKHPPKISRIQQALCEESKKSSPSPNEQILIGYAQTLFKELQSVSGYRAAAILNKDWEVLTSDTRSEKDPPLFAAFCHRIEPLIEKLTQNCKKYVFEDEQQLTISAHNGTLLSFSTHYESQLIHILCLLGENANLVLAKLYLLKLWKEEKKNTHPT